MSAIEKEIDALTRPHRALVLLRDVWREMSSLGYARQATWEKVRVLLAEEAPPTEPRR